MLRILSKFLNLFYKPNDKRFTVAFQSKQIKKNKYHQRFDENYDIKVGQEYLDLCLNHKKFPEYNYFHHRLRELRGKSSLKQSEAAKALGISVSTLSSYENQKTVPNENTITMISNFYNVPKSFLLHGWSEDFNEHLTLCKNYNEENYITSLSIAIRGAYRYFPDKITSSQQEKCEKAIEILGLKIKYN